MGVDAGVLVVDKAPGVTSFDAVTLVRRRLGLRRVGHAGTLDPAATGVLPILLGEATKLTPYLMDQEKEYVATVRFGLTTDTQDVGGRVLSDTPVPSLARRELEDACRPFVGRIKQVPPMYSAVHHEGRRLEGGRLLGLEAGVGLTGAIRPRHCEAVDVGPGDLRGGAIAGSLRIAPVGVPVDFLAMQCDGRDPEQQHRHQSTHDHLPERRYNDV